MAVRLANSVFLHVPHTGGNWVTEVLSKMGLVVDRTTNAHLSWKNIVSNPSGSDGSRPFREWCGLRPFVFIRHPVTWFASRWGYKMRNGWNMQGPTDKETAAPTFDGFVRKCVARDPGGIGRMYLNHTAGARFVGRYESLRNDLSEVLRLFEGIWDFSLIEKTPSVNASEALHRAPALYTQELLDLVNQTEQKTLGMWGYEPFVLPNSVP